MCIDSVYSCVCTLDLCVILCLVLLAFDGQLHSVPRQMDFLPAWILDGKKRYYKKGERQKLAVPIMSVSDPLICLDMCHLKGVFSEGVNAFRKELAVVVKTITSLQLH